MTWVIVIKQMMIMLMTKMMMIWWFPCQQPSSRQCGRPTGQLKVIMNPKKWKFRCSLLMTRFSSLTKFLSHFCISALMFACQQLSSRRWGRPTGGHRCHHWHHHHHHHYSHYYLANSTSFIIIIIIHHHHHDHDIVNFVSIIIIHQSNKLMPRKTMLPALWYTDSVMRGSQAVGILSFSINLVFFSL